MNRLIIPLLWLIGTGVLTAQDVPKVTQTILLKNGIVTSAPGQIDSSASILLKDGIITATGRSVTAPYDARVVDLDSLYVYPGFIAGASYIGVPKPKEERGRPNVDRPGYPPDDVAGIVPETSLSESYDHTDGGIESFRKMGFTISHSMPHGRMLPGMSGVISLNGEAYNKAVISDDHATLLQMRGSRGMFPATEIGVMAKWRELYKNVEIATKSSAMYNNSPLSRKRPEMTPAEAALMPVVAKQRAVYQPAAKQVNISRAIGMQKEMGYKLVLAEVQQAHMAHDMIKSSGTQLLLSLDIPDEVKEEKKDSTKAAKELTWKEKEMEAMTAKKKKSVEEYVSQAALAAKANIPVAFSYLETSAKDVHPNIRRLIAAGLSPQDALAALTTVPAQTLGISNIAGTIAKGKIANMVVMTGPLFDEKSEIKMVIVDGVIHEYESKPKKKKGKGDGSDMDLTGSWSFVIEVPGMEPSGTIKMTKTDEGTYDMVLTNSAVPGEDITVTGVELDGQDMSYSYTVNVQGMSATIDAEVTYEEDSFEGMVNVGQFGSFKITGEKLPE